MLRTFVILLALATRFTVAENSGEQVFMTEITIYKTHEFPIPFFARLPHVYFSCDDGQPEIYLERVKETYHTYIFDYSEQPSTVLGLNSCVNCKLKERHIFRRDEVFGDFTLCLKDFEETGFTYVSVDKEFKTVFECPTCQSIVTFQPPETLSSTEAPTESPTSSEAPTESPASSEAPTESPASSEAPTESPASSEAPTESPASSEAPTESPTSSEAPTESPTSSEAPTESPTSSEAPTESPVPSEVPKKKPISSEVPQTMETKAAPQASEEATNIEADIGVLALSIDDFYVGRNSGSKILKV